MRFTRYSDDLCFSSRNGKFGRKLAEHLVSDVYASLNEHGFLPQLRKTTIVPPSAKKIVLGLNVEGKVPLLSKETKDKIRQHLHYSEKHGVVEHAFNRGFDSVWGLKAHLKGLIDYANMVEPSFAALSLDKFEKIDWPV